MARKPLPKSLNLVQRAIHKVSILGIVEFPQSDGANFQITSHNLYILGVNK